MAPESGGALVSFQVWPPSLDVAVLALFGSLGSKSPPPTMPCQGSRKSTVKAPALGELTSGVLYAFHVSPPSRVLRILAMVDPAVARPAFRSPWIATQEPLAANDA